MTTEHPTRAQLSRYQERILTPAELLVLDRHLAACPSCRDALLRSVNANALVSECRNRLTEHLGYEQVVSCAEGRPDPEAESHLHACDSCRQEVADLRAFRARLQPSRPPWLIPAWIAAAAAVIVLAGMGLRNVTRPTPQRPAQQATVPAESPLTQEQRGLIAALESTQKLPRASVLDQLIAKPGVLLGEPAGNKSFELTAPVGTAVLQDRPVFRWQPVRGASQYVVSVFDQDFHVAAQSPAIPAPEWQPAVALPRGQVLVWQVTATVGTDSLRAPVPPAPEARFEILEAATASGIEQTRREHPADHRLLAAILARSGALDEAAAEIDALGAADPDSARALRQSLAEIRSR